MIIFAKKANMAKSNIYYHSIKCWNNIIIAANPVSSSYSVLLKRNTILTHAIRTTSREPIKIFNYDYERTWNAFAN